MSEHVEIVGDPSRPSTRVDNPETIDNPILSFFLEYWRAKRGGRLLPSHESFVPGEIRKHLPWVVVADALPGYEDFRLRVVGSRVADYFLGDGTGKTIREAFAGADEELREGFVWLFRHVCELRAPVRLTGPGSAGKTPYYPNFDVCYLPYSTDGIRADRVVNAFTFNHREMRAVRDAVQRNSTGASGSF